MATDQKNCTPEAVGVSLVDADADVRHARQLMLRSENYAVRAYPTCAALLADPRSRDYPCVILDLEMDEVDGTTLLRQMRGSGWRGKALLLDGLQPGSPLLAEAERHGDTVLRRDVGDGALLTALAASVDRGWSGWNAAG